jgi:hypothetical protein
MGRCICGGAQGVEDPNGNLTTVMQCTLPYPAEAFNRIMTDIPLQVSERASVSTVRPPSPSCMGSACTCVGWCRWSMGFSGVGVLSSL